MGAATSHITDMCGVCEMKPMVTTVFMKSVHHDQEATKVGDCLVEEKTDIEHVNRRRTPGLRLAAVLLLRKQCTGKQIITSTFPPQKKCEEWNYE